MKLNIKNIGAYLKSHGIKPSYQRLQIFEYLLRYRNHPTVDMIYKSLSPAIPTLSKTTVYNTLKLFVEKKIALVIVIEENETRYDADTSIHGHFKCEKCSSMTDLAVDTSQLKLPDLNGFQINEHHFYFKGLCKKCLTM
jgi:Fe2+ or Zn2+ uptake regulation protein